MAKEKIKLVYNKVNKDNKLNGSFTGVPTEKDVEINVEKAANAKLVYVKDGAIMASIKNVPTAEDVEICKVADLSEAEKPIETKAVIENSQSEPANTEAPTTDSANNAI